MSHFDEITSLYAIIRFLYGGQSFRGRLLYTGGCEQSETVIRWGSCIRWYKHD